MEEEKRRFPAPWYVHQSSDRAFQVLDSNGLPLAHVYFRSRELEWAGPGAYGAYELSEGEARAIAKGIARLPELLGKEQDRRWCLLHPILNRMLRKIGE